MPEGRDQAIYKSIIQDKNGFLAYVSFMLSDDYSESCFEQAEIAKQFLDNTDPQTAQIPAALYERMLHCAMNNPYRLLDLENLIAELGDDHFKVVYICSNINIANQNSKKLGIPVEDCLNINDSRLSMQHLKIYRRQGRDHSYRQLIPLTPATSFSMTGGCGTQYERALMYVLLRRMPVFKCLHLCGVTN